MGFFALIAESADGEKSGGEEEVVIAWLEGRTSRAASKIQIKRQELECTSSLLIHL